MDADETTQAIENPRWLALSDEELKEAFRGIVRSSASEEEARERFVAKLDYRQPVGMAVRPSKDERACLRFTTGKQVMVMFTNAAGDSLQL